MCGHLPLVSTTHAHCVATIAFRKTPRLHSEVARGTKTAKISVCNVQSIVLAARSVAGRRRSVFSSTAAAAAAGSARMVTQARAYISSFWCRLTLTGADPEGGHGVLNFGRFLRANIKYCIHRKHRTKFITNTNLGKTKSVNARKKSSFCVPVAQCL